MIISTTFRFKIKKNTSLVISGLVNKYLILYNTYLFINLKITTEFIIMI